MSGTQPIEDHDVVVIGAGFAGVYALHRLRNQSGLRVKAVEAGSDVGGTWYWNTYPGARCDTESYVYCYSFSPELCQEWEWSGRYPGQSELQAYIRHVADRFDLRRDIDFDTRATEARFDEDSNTWTVTTDTGATYRAPFLVTAVGLLSHRFVPDLPGLADFAGEWYHTSRWPAEGVDFTGRRVGLIGTGSTGVQAAPVIAREAAHLDVFQRSPQFAIPARHELVDKKVLDEIKADYDSLWEQVRWSTGGFPFQHNGFSALEVSEDDRERTYWELWREGGVKFLFGSFRDLMLDRRANDTVAEFIRVRIREAVEDPEVAEALVPTDHPYGSRRPIVHTDYYEMFNRPNVSLVDCRHFPIQRVTETGIEVANGHRELDVIVFATGFDAVTGAYLAMDIRGRGDQRLLDKWGRGIQSYLGLSVSGFPNLFMVQGPGSTFGNQVVAIEHHVDWIAGCITDIRTRGAVTIEARPEAEASWSAQMLAAAEESLVVHADSWWNGANIPGKVRSIVFFPGSFRHYRKTCDRIADEGYAGFELGWPDAGGGRATVA
ncbi:flavin-containing monooxygenase [Actinophytocola sp.]|uniref:flavin-containing monooxygenase n=1 Tax=Actinophytocola sp. TaxID=1872138 RepID=UPI003D6C39E0